MRVRITMSGGTARYRIEQDRGAVVVELTEVAGKQGNWLDTFGECQASRCSCPTDEYGHGQPLRARVGPVAPREGLSGWPAHALFMDSSSTTASSFSAGR